MTKEVTRKFRNHLWYLGEETIYLAFFDKNVSVDTKRNMLANLHSLDEDEKIGEASKRLTVEPSDVANLVSEDLIDLYDWSTRNDFRLTRKVMKSLKVVNDTAERNVQ